MDKIDYFITKGTMEDQSNVKFIFLNKKSDISYIDRLRCTLKKNHFMYMFLFGSVIRKSKNICLERIQEHMVSESDYVVANLERIINLEKSRLKRILETINDMKYLYNLMYNEDLIVLSVAKRHLSFEKVIPKYCSNKRFLKSKFKHYYR